MRIRTVKPEFWLNEDISSVGAETALLAIGLLNMADDEGYFNANPKLIEAMIFPLRELSSTVTVLLLELSEIGYLEVFEGSDGKKYGHVKNFAAHQVINKKKPSKIKHLRGISYEYSTDTVTVPVERKGKEGNGKEYIDRFAEFWNLYPRKIGKPKAHASWKSATKLNEEKQQEVLDGLKRHLPSLNGKEIQFVPHPTTWLNGHRWQDPVEFNKSAPQSSMLAGGI